MGLYSRGMAARYFAEEIAPRHRRSGVPEEAIASMGRRYVSDVDANHAAQLELVEHYDQQSEPPTTRDFNLALRIEHSPEPTTRQASAD